MNYIIPTPILTWMRSIDPEVWVWARFLTLVWAVIAIIVFIVAVMIMKWSDTPSQKNNGGIVTTALMYALPWPIWLLIGSLVAVANSWSV